MDAIIIKKKVGGRKLIIKPRNVPLATATATAPVVDGWESIAPPYSFVYVPEPVKEKKPVDLDVTPQLTTENVAKFIERRKGGFAKDIAKHFGTTKHLVNTSHDGYLGLYQNPYIVLPYKNEYMWFHKSEIGKDCKTCEICGVKDEDGNWVETATGKNGWLLHVCECCNEGGSNYNGWGDKDIMC